MSDTDGPVAAAPPATKWWLRPPFGAHSVTILFILANVILVSLPMFPELFGHGKHKDYPLWFSIGRSVLTGGDIYPVDPNGKFAFLYPPFAAVLLAPLALFGRSLCVLAIALVTTASWWAAARLSDRLSGVPGPKAWWIVALPSVIALPFIWDMYDLGQPNLMLLAIILAGLALLQVGRQWSAGAMFAAAVALKAFPIAMILPYLLWRRRWVSAASMVIFAGVFLVLAPAPFRGFERNISDLKTWSQGMVLSASEKGFGQRPEQNWGWKNNSVIAVTHRLVRPINAEAEDPKAPPLYVNLLNLTYDHANDLVLAVVALLGLGFIAVLPAERRRTPTSDAAEFAILIALMTIASPLARAYYFVWLLFPFTVMVYRAALDPEPKVRRTVWILLGLTLAIFTAGISSVKPHWLPAYGNMLWATCVLIGALVWLMRRSALPAPKHAERSAPVVGAEAPAVQNVS